MDRKGMNTEPAEGNLAIVLAAGRGTRMHSDVPKQYLAMGGKPVLAHSLSVFEACDRVQGILLVTGADDAAWCEKNIRDACGFRKILAVIPGGALRCDSVYAGLRYLKRNGTGCRHVLIHDGARPLIDEALVLRNLECAGEWGCAVTGMPVKDTIKICDEKGRVESTPVRDRVWQVQTPQTFLFEEICDAYDRLYSLEEKARPAVTDDAMVMEQFGSRGVHMCRGSYLNLKITTPEDLVLAEQILKRRD